MTAVPVRGASRLLHWIGTSLGVAGLAFVTIRHYSYAGEIDFREVGLDGALAIAGLAAVYGASGLLLALGWQCLIRHLGSPVSMSWAIRAYAVSQLAKYVPGNIFQFAGRQAIGAAAGLANAALAKSTALELVLLTIGGLLFLPLALPLAVADIPYWVAVFPFAAMVAAALWLARRIAGAGIAAAAGWYMAFLVLSGVIFLGAYRLAGGTLQAETAAAIAGAYVLAWLAGLLTPGAPAGLGVREAVLLFLLGGLSTEPVILMAVVIGRLITVLGDLLFFVGGQFSNGTGRINN